MIGAVFGLAKGVAPGLEWDLTWGPLELTSTGEFVFDFANWGASDFDLLGGGAGVALAMAQARCRAHPHPGHPDQIPGTVGAPGRSAGLEDRRRGVLDEPGNSSDQYWSATLSLNF